jgi:hypothetical protein
MASDLWTGRLALVAIAMALAAGSAQAQTQPQAQSKAAAKSPARAPAPADDEEDEDEATVSELVVTAAPERPQRGAVVGDIKPELQLGPADIQSYGVSSLTDLLNELAPEIRSDRGRGGEAPVVLLNGRRISGFNEIRDIPTEAILRVDILPEEAALKYGYSADQRVVNIVLRRRFRAVTAEAGGGGSTEGGQASGTAESDLFRVRGDNRLNLDLKAQASSAVTEAERGLSPPNGDRTLTPETWQVSANGVAAKALSRDTSGTLNLTLGATHSGAIRGLPTGLNATVDTLAAGGPLRQDADGWTAHAGQTLNRERGNWRLSLTGTYDHAAADTDSDVATVASTGAVVRGTETAKSSSDEVNVRAVASGPLVQAPAGPLYVSLRVGDDASWFSSDSNRGGLPQSADLSRNSLGAQANLDLPITSRRKGVLPFVGDLTLNANAAVNHLSDFGTLSTLGAGANWTPRTGVTFIVSATRDEAAPSTQQLGGPVITTEASTLFDFATGQTAAVRRLDGGNPDLTSDVRHVLKVGLTLKPLPTQNLTFTANYIRTRTENPIETFPAATAQIEAAFPDRFVRDAAGNLVQVDFRPVNFAEARTSELRWGFNYSRPIGPQPPPRFRRPGGGPRRPDGAGPDGAAPDGAPSPASDSAGAPSPSGGFGGRGFGGGGRGGFGGGGFGGGGRLQFAVYNTIHFQDQLTVRESGSVLDLLHGAAAGSGGGQPREEIEAQAGITEKGLGARITANWLSGTEVNGPLGDLHFGSLAKVNLRLFYNLGADRSLVARDPWARGVRLTLAVNNLFDAREDVRDASGATPRGYEPAFLDPLGRVVQLSLRKVFY